MVGPDDLLTAIQNRKPGQTVIYGNADDGGYWITVTTHATTASNNVPATTDTYSCPGPWCSCGACNHRHHRSYHDEYPWERDLKEIIAMGAKFREIFKTIFRGGWIPHKGYGGPSFAPDPPETTNTPAPLDLRRAIRVITTPRPCRVP